MKNKERKSKLAELKFKKRLSTSSSSSLYKKHLLSELPTPTEILTKQESNISLTSFKSSDEKKSLSFSKASSNLIRKQKTHETTAESTSLNEVKRGWIGPLTVSERQEKVMKYLQKKRSKNQMKKFCYKCRK